MTVWMAGIAAENTSPRFRPPMLKPDNFCWMLCSPSGVVSWPKTCLILSPMPEIFPVNASKTARSPSPNIWPTMFRTSSKWSPSRETTATMVPRLVIAGPKVPSSDIKPPPSFPATAPMPPVRFKPPLPKTAFAPAPRTFPIVAVAVPAGFAAAIMAFTALVGMFATLLM